MHTNQPKVLVSQIKDMIERQFPDWAELPLTPFDSTGTSHSIFRLGDKMAVRLPLTESARLQAEKERRWLPILAQQVQVSIPLPLGTGKPSAEFPFSWSVYSWLEGENPTREGVSGKKEFALDIASFVRALQQIDPTGGPEPGVHNFFRGVPLDDRDASTREAISQLTNRIDTRIVSEIWNAALEAPPRTDKPIWIHGDLYQGNLLAHDGRLTAVIDFGGLGVGDPACDLIVAWWLLSYESRQIFRDELEVDDATWSRGRGWALSMALIALPYYSDSNPGFAQMAQRAINEVVGDDST